jgi:hypothetical protein
MLMPSDYFSFNRSSSPDREKMVSSNETAINLKDPKAFLEAFKQIFTVSPELKKMVGSVTSFYKMKKFVQIKSDEPYHYDFESADKKISAIFYEMNVFWRDPNCSSASKGPGILLVLNNPAEVAPLPVHTETGANAFEKALASSGFTMDKYQRLKAILGLIKIDYDAYKNGELNFSSSEEMSVEDKSAAASLMKLQDNRVKNAKLYERHHEVFDPAVQIINAGFE